MYAQHHRHALARPTHVLQSPEVQVDTLSPPENELNNTKLVRNSEDVKQPIHAKL